MDEKFNTNYIQKLYNSSIIKIYGVKEYVEYTVLLHSSLQNIVQLEKRELKTRAKAKKFELKTDILPVIVSDEYYSSMI